MQYVFFEKRIRSVKWGPGQSPRSWGIFKNFCVKSNLTPYKVTFNCKLEKNGGTGCTSCFPNNFVGGATAASAPPVRAPMAVTLGTLVLDPRLAVS